MDPTLRPAPAAANRKTNWIMSDRADSKGVSLAKGPIAILGLIGLAYGLSGLIFASHAFALHIPHGAVTGKHWLGLLVNGWSDLLFIAAGLALLLFSPVHAAAKSMAVLVGWVLIAAAVVAVIRGNGVFGIFAANKLTELIWAAAGVLLLIVAWLPRVGGSSGHERPEQTRRAAPQGPRSHPRHKRAEPTPARQQQDEGAQQDNTTGAHKVDTTHEKEHSR